MLAMVDLEELEQFGLLLLARVHQPDLRTHLSREQFHHVVAERLGGGHHLAVLHQEADDIGGGPVELRAEVLSRRGPFDHHNPVRHRGVTGRVSGNVDRLQLLTHPPTSALASRRAALRTAGSATASRACASTRNRRTRPAQEVAPHLARGGALRHRGRDPNRDGLPPVGPGRLAVAGRSVPHRVGAAPQAGQLDGHDEAEGVEESACPIVTRAG